MLNMSKEKVFKELIVAVVQDGKVNPSAYSILVEKGMELGLNKRAVDLLIQMEMSESERGGFESTSWEGESTRNWESDIEDKEYTFKSAITRGGGILTPDIIIITRDTVTLKRRNKYLINVDSISIPISKIAAVQVDTGIIGSDVIIKSVGAGEITGKRFTKSDAHEIRDLIQERQRQKRI